MFGDCWRNAFIALWYRLHQSRVLQVEWECVDQKIIGGHKGSIPMRSQHKLRFGKKGQKISGQNKRGGQLNSFRFVRFEAVPILVALASVQLWRRRWRSWRANPTPPWHSKLRQVLPWEVATKQSKYFQSRKFFFEKSAQTPRTWDQSNLEKNISCASVNNPHILLRRKYWKFVAVKAGKSF